MNIYSIETNDFDCTEAGLCCWVVIAESPGQALSINPLKEGDLDPERQKSKITIECIGVSHKAEPEVICVDYYRPVHYSY